MKNYFARNLIIADQQEEGIQSMSELAMSDTTQGSEEDEVYIINKINLTCKK